MKNFEEYLIEIYAEKYAGIKEAMPDAFDEWLCNMDVYDMIDYSDKYAELVRTRTITETIKLIEGMFK